MMLPTIARLKQILASLAIAIASEIIGASGTDTLVGIESLEFSDGEVAIDDLNLLPASLYDDVEVIETTMKNFRTWEVIR